MTSPVRVMVVGALGLPPITLLQHDCPTYAAHPRRIPVYSIIQIPRSSYCSPRQAASPGSPRHGRQSCGKLPGKLPPVELLVNASE